MMIRNEWKTKSNRWYQKRWRNLHQMIMIMTSPQPQIRKRLNHIWRPGYNSTWSSEKPALHFLFDTALSCEERIVSIFGLCQLEAKITGIFWHRQLGAKMSRIFGLNQMQYLSLTQYLQVRQWAKPTRAAARRRRENIFLILRFWNIQIS